VDEDAEVSIDTGLRATEKLQAVLDRRGQRDEIAEMRVQVSKILDAVKSTVPQEMWGAIVNKLDQPEQHPEAIDAETEDFDDDEDGYDPMELAEDDDEL
jgi:hypothetical protein